VGSGQWLVMSASTGLSFCFHKDLMMCESRLLTTGHCPPATELC
jgi:hypothetical protein